MLDGYKRACCHSLMGFNSLPLFYKFFKMNLLFLGMSAGSIFIVVLAVLLLFGSKELPTIARTLGKGIREIKNATSEIQNEVTKGTQGTAVEDIKKIKDDLDVTKHM